jgi:hypothetical protein
VFDALYLALRRPWPGGRPLVVVYTDGADTMSWVGAESVLAAARESSAVVYVVGPERSRNVNVPGPRISTGRRDRLPHPRDDDMQRLDGIAEMTGGQFLAVDLPSDLEARFLEILSRMRTRYVLGFEPRGVENEGRHRLEVRVKRRGATVRHRLEYSRP